MFGFRDPDPLDFMDPKFGFHIFYAETVKYPDDVAFGKYTMV
jgi:hypothetical protein